MSEKKYVDNTAPAGAGSASSPLRRLVLYSPTRGLCLGGKNAVAWSREVDDQVDYRAPTWPLGTNVSVVISGMPHVDIIPADARLVELNVGDDKSTASRKDCEAAGLIWGPR